MLANHICRTLANSSCIHQAHNQFLEWTLAKFRCKNHLGYSLGHFLEKGCALPQHPKLLRFCHLSQSGVCNALYGYSILLLVLKADLNLLEILIEMKIPPLTGCPFPCMNGGELNENCSCICDSDQHWLGEYCSGNFTAQISLSNGNGNCGLTFCCDFPFVSLVLALQALEEWRRRRREKRGKEQEKT